jgi:aminoglycoside phosphotransferase (APT) family kinase protein
MPQVRRGVFAGGDLAIQPFHIELPDWLGQVGEDAQSLLEEERRSCLVHSDLNPKNLLFDPETLAITGVLDWEFAHAGHPFTDLGNLLRFDREPAYVDGVLGAYAELRDTPRERALELARAADLYALAELASRAGQNPVATRAAAHLDAITLAQDVHALP